MKMPYTEEKSRYQAYDETIKNLEQKDFKGLASLAIPDIDEADDVSLSMYELSMADMKKPDYVVKMKLLVSILYFTWSLNPPIKAIRKCKDVC